MKKLFFGLMFVFVLAACGGVEADPLVGQWELVSHGSAADQTPAAQGVDTNIEFKSDGTLGGNVGCNGFGGDYQVDGRQVSFGSIVSTAMFCEGPVGAQEETTLKVFFESATFVLDGEFLTFTSTDGASVIVLARK